MFNSFHACTLPYISSSCYYKFSSSSFSRGKFLFILQNPAQLLVFSHSPDRMNYFHFAPCSIYTYIKLLHAFQFCFSTSSELSDPQKKISILFFYVSVWARCNEQSLVSVQLKWFISSAFFKSFKSNGPQTWLLPESPGGGHLKTQILIFHYSYSQIPLFSFLNNSVQSH